MTILDSVMYAGYSIGTKLGVAIKETYGWTPLFLSALLLHVMNVLYISFRIKEAKKVDNKQDDDITEESSSEGILLYNCIFDL